MRIEWVPQGAASAARAGVSRSLSQPFKFNIAARAAAIAACSLFLGACSLPNWLETAGPKPAPVGKITQIVSFESEPWGAVAQLSNGQSCRAPCSLWVSADDFVVSFTLPGYEPQSVQVPQPLRKHRRKKIRYRLRRSTSLRTRSLSR